MVKSRFVFIKILVILLIVASVSSLCGCTESGTDYVTTPEPSFVSVEGKLQIYCFSIGRADAFLITTENSSVLIDTGDSGYTTLILDYMKKVCGKKLDYLILTHFDEDHIGGAQKIIKKCEITNILQSNYPKDNEEYKEYTEAVEFYKLAPVTVTETTEFTLDDVKFTVIPPKDTYEEDPSNNSSLIVTLDYGSKHFLFMGDARKERVKDFTETNTQTYDFLKVPYHGEWFKALGAFVESVKPSYAVITSSDEEKEDDSTVNLLNQSGTKIFLTRTSPVLVKCDGENISAEYVSR